MMAGVVLESANICEGGRGCNTMCLRKRPTCPVLDGTEDGSSVTQCTVGRWSRGGRSHGFPCASGNVLAHLERVLLEWNSGGCQRDVVALLRGCSPEETVVKLSILLNNPRKERQTEMREQSTKKEACRKE